MRATTNVCDGMTSTSEAQLPPSFPPSLSIEFGIPDGLSHSNLSLAGRPATDRPPTPPMKAEEERIL